MAGELDGAVALVTGADGVVGDAICAALGNAGAILIRTDAAPRGDAWPLDVTDEAAWVRIIEQVRVEHGRLDILVNNAGVAPTAKLEDMPLEDWRRVQAVNVDGAFLGIKAATPLLRESGALRRGGSAIVTIASGAADRAAAFSAAYCTSKAAAAMLTRAAALEFATLGYPIRVNAVHPGAVRSTMMDSILNRYAEITGLDRATMSEAVLARHPMGRYVEPDEVADAVLFLASPAARYVHGDSLHVDGGYAAA